MAAQPVRRCSTEAAASASAASPQGRIGGGEGVEGLYGSISRTGMARVLAAMAAHCDLKRSSCLVDVGAGLGRWVITTWPPLCREAQKQSAAIVLGVAPRCTCISHGRWQL